MQASTAALIIYVSEGCPGCARALATARAVEEHRPDITVDVVDLSDGRMVPPQVFSVPTYLLDGQVFSLGNPQLAVLLASLPAASTSESE